MVILPVAKIPFGMVEDMALVPLEIYSCELWICERNNDFWEKNRFYCNGIGIRDVFSW